MKKVTTLANIYNEYFKDDRDNDTANEYWLK